jgi:hypothetical protein
MSDLTLCDLDGGSGTVRWAVRFPRNGSAAAVGVALPTTALLSSAGFCADSSVWTALETDVSMGVHDECYWPSDCERTFFRWSSTSVTVTCVADLRAQCLWLDVQLECEQDTPVGPPARVGGPVPRLADTHVYALGNATVFTLVDLR